MALAEGGLRCRDDDRPGAHFPSLGYPHGLPEGNDEDFLDADSLDHHCYGPLKIEIILRFIYVIWLNS